MITGRRQCYCCAVDRGLRSLRQRQRVRQAKFVELLDRRGIRRECIRVGSPKHNGVVERHIAMMLDGFLPKSSPPVRRREVTVDGTPLGRGVQARV